MSIRNEKDLKGLEAVARLARQLREALAALAVPGVTTRALDRICGRLLREAGGLSAPKAEYQAPCQAFYSVNEAVVHGLPDDRPLQAGDLLKIDVTPRLGGYVADTACTVLVGGQASPQARALDETGRLALKAALAQVRPGLPLRELGRTVENTARGRGHAVVPGLSGHGVGRAVHEPPTVPNWYDHRFRGALTEGLVIAIEPMLSLLPGRVEEAADGWTLSVRGRGQLSVHYEHTVVVTRQGPLVLTA